jgi:hypothetical protein
MMIATCFGNFSGSIFIRFRYFSLSLQLSSARAGGEDLWYQRIYSINLTGNSKKILPFIILAGGAIAPAMGESDDFIKGMEFKIR